ncbi:MAG: glycosyltransferase [Muribaculaceae bacterium]|nr:glycosyltransferase [Muribaculaceae bacterium]
MKNDRRHTLLVASHGLDAITRDMLSRAERQSGGELRVLVAGPGEAIEAPEIRSKADIRAARAYRGIMKREGVDTTFSPSTSGLATMLWASMGLGIRNIGYRGTQAKVRRSDPTNLLGLLNPRVSHIVCETADIAESLGAKVGRGKVSVATKPFDLAWVEEAMSAPLHVKEAEGCFSMSYVGVSKGRPHKGLRTLLEAIRLLEGEKLHLTVVGDADEADIEFAKGLPVSFIATTPDAVRYLPESDLYILSSLRDASPRTLREAQACGVPCIVSDIPGARELISPGETGLLVPAGDAVALADAIRMLHSDELLRKEMARACRPFIARRFDTDEYARYFLNLFSDKQIL